MAGVPQGGPGPAPAPSASSPGNVNLLVSSSTLAGPKCLSDAIRTEPFPEKFKEPSKIANYEPSIDPASWLSSYEMAMCIRNATENVFAKYMYLMMSDGAAKLWFKNLPEKSINSWDELKAVFTKHFQGTCKRLFSIEDLDRCIQKKRRVSSSLDGPGHGDPALFIWY